MMVDLNHEAVDGLVKSILIQDYQGLCQDIDRIENIKTPAKCQTQDLADNYRYKDAMETLMEYYVGFDWKDRP